MEFIKENQFVSAFIASVLTVAVGLMMFVVLEPSVGHAVDDVFVVEQIIIGEISFLATSTDVTLADINGLTGGVSNGSYEVVVTTNDADGYAMTLSFEDAVAMQRDTGGGVIANYSPVGIPDISFDPDTEVFGQFAFTVSADNISDLVQRFRNDGVVCNDAGGGDAIASCWDAPSSGIIPIVNTSSATSASGATTTIHFRIDVPNNPVPAIPTGTYHATATLTATVN